MDDFIRKNKIAIEKYLPEFISKDETLKAIMELDDKEHENIRAVLKEILDQFFIDTATWGIDIWEKILDIQSLSNENILYRRKQILNRLRGRKTSTVDIMTKIVNTYGAGYIVEHNDRYYFNIFVSCNDETAKKKLKEDILMFKPAHLGVNVYLGYSWNGDINFSGKYTFSSSQDDWSELD